MTKKTLKNAIDIIGCYIENRLDYACENDCVAFMMNERQEIDNTLNELKSEYLLLEKETLPNA
jgi:hypothetical protein